MKKIIPFLIYFICFLLALFIVVLIVNEQKEKINDIPIAAVEKSPIQLEKPRYKLKRHSCENYVCAPQ